MTQPSDFTLTLNQDDINKLSEALGNMPFKMVAPLVNKLNQQLGAQVAAQAKTSLPAPPPPTHATGAAEQPSA